MLGPNNKTSNSLSSRGLSYICRKTILRRACAILGIGIVCGAIVWIVNVWRDSTEPRCTRMQFLEIGVSLSAYSDNFDHLPFPVRRAPVSPTEMYWRNGEGMPLYSWRVEIVPYLESWHGEWDTTKPWNSDANRQLLEMSGFYTYDQSFFSRTVSDADTVAFPETNALAITGPGTAFGDGQEPPRALKDIPGNSILVVESRASGIPWPSPGDFDLRTMPQAIDASNGKNISSRYRRGFHVLFADGSVWFLANDVPFVNLKRFFTIEDARKYDREEILGPYALRRTQQ